jgi:hypothetical protein
MVCNVDGKTDKDGRDIYVGESSSSMYERAWEHQHDREVRAEDSHQVKHWAIDHPELSSPPKFKFKIIQSFTDPLTRQLAEAVRIERRGVNILNSKSELSWCRVPRLVINCKEWKKKDKEEKTNMTESENDTEKKTKSWWRSWREWRMPSEGKKEKGKIRHESPKVIKRKEGSLRNWWTGVSLS